MAGAGLAKKQKNNEVGLPPPRERGRGEGKNFDGGGREPSTNRRDRLRTPLPTSDTKTHNASRE